MKKILLLALTFAALGRAQALLEDFATVRVTPAGNQLFQLYLGEDPNQNSGFVDGMFWAQGDPNRYMYWHFYPIPYVYPGGFAQGWIKSGSPNANYNRLRFEFKCNQSFSRRADSGNIIDLGSYVKHHGETTGNVQGQHYYHGFNPNIYNGRWLIFWLNRRPQHAVGAGNDDNPEEDPEWVGPTTGAPVHYFDGLTRFYFNAYGPFGNSGATCYFDNFTFSEVANEPDYMVSSVSATHSGTRYEVGFAAPKSVLYTFQVRYSTSSMKVGGFLSGTDGGTVENRGDTYPTVFWSSPSIAEQQQFYVAIRPTGFTNFTEILIPAMSGGGAAPGITTTSLPAGTVGVAYSQTLQATGSTPITWGVTAGSLPGGLVLHNTTGVIDGTPTTQETQNFTVSATNSVGNDTQALSIAINPVGQQPPTITTTVLPSGTVGFPYYQTLQATGTTPITWGLQTGSLPTGLVLHTDTGIIDGTPTTVETQNFTVSATNSAGSDTHSLSIAVNAQGGAITFVQAAALNSWVGGNISVAFPSNNTAGSAIVVVAGWDDTTPAIDGNVTDTRGNSYSLVGQINDGRSLAMWYAVNVTAGTNTVTFAAPTSWSTIAIAEYSGIKTTKPAVDGFVGRRAAGTTATDNVSSGTFTPTVNGDLIVGGVDEAVGANYQVYTKGTAFTAIRAQNNEGANIAVAIEDYVQATAAQTAATFTQEKASTYICIGAALKAASPAGYGRKRVLSAQ